MKLTDIRFYLYQFDLNNDRDPVFRLLWKKDKMYSLLEEMRK